MGDVKMRQTYLPDCNCDTKRIIIVDNIVRCGECYKQYGEGGSYYYTDEFLKFLIDNADKNDRWYQIKVKIDKGFTFEQSMEELRGVKMRLESKCADVTVQWDKKNSLEIIIRSKNGFILLSQVQGEKGGATNINSYVGWDGIYE